jgi:hypothetical protein
MKPLDAALALAMQGHRVFFCHADKTPACPHGFKNASNDPAAVRDLHHRYPGPLIAVAAGDLDILDLDRKHPEAIEWWQQHRAHLPKTRTHRTGSGGLHLLFLHHEGLRNWTAWPVRGVDCRASGGYFIWWPAAGRPVLDNASPAPWPDWLLEQRVNSFNSFLSYPDTSAFLPAAGNKADRYAAAALRSAVDRVKSAGEGARNHTLNSEAYGLARLVHTGLLGGQEVADALAAAAMAAGLRPKETVLTLKSAFKARGA